MPQKTRLLSLNAGRNGLLACLSLALGLVFCEVALRWLHPRYEHIAAPPERSYNNSYAYRHPETGIHHNVLHNRFGSRQHRDFGELELAAASNLAFFGDSFTENVRLPVHYAFTEVLDFLLNAGHGSSSNDAPARFNVLNFGMDGTGPGSQYAVYRSLSFKHHLQRVFYVHHENDIWDLRHADPWALGANGEFVARLAYEGSPWVRVLSRLHLTYLALDVWWRLVPTTSSMSNRIQSDTLVVFENLLRSWRREVEGFGGAFHVVLLPEPMGDKWFRETKSLASWPVVNLNECFSEVFPKDAVQRWTFKNDQHWNEAGNMVAAHCLYRHLEGELALPKRSDRDLAPLRFAYYRAFERSALTGSRWMPAAPWVRATALAEGEARRIVQRYHALAGDAAREGSAARALRDTDAVLRSSTGWNVYFNRQRRLVVFNREDCGHPSATGNSAEGLFLRLHPWNPWDLAAHERGDGFSAYKPVPILAGGAGQPDEGGQAPERTQECILAAALPSYPLRSAQVGQLGLPSGKSSAEVTWEGEFLVDGAEVWQKVVARQRLAYQLLVDTPPAAQAVWDIYRSPARREVVFVKEPCVVDDILAEFFLDVRGARSEQQVGEAQWVRAPPIMNTEVTTSGFRRRATATMFEGKCLLTVPLPAWDIGAVRAGQRVPGSATKPGGAWRKEVFWETKFQWSADRFRQAWRAVRGKKTAESGAFDVHRHAGALTYVRDSCDLADVRARFFLHVAAAPGEVSGENTEFNLDFDFGERGALFDGKCVAIAPLPDERITRIRTGQFLPDAGELWSVDLPIE